MTGTEQEFLAILRAAVRGEPLPEGFSVEAADALFRLARAQDLGHLLAAVPVPLDEAAHALAERERLRAIWRVGVLTHEHSRITALLDREGIPYIPLKGAVLRDLWPEAWMRTSCDIDILVHEEDVLRAGDAIARELSYTRREQGHHDHALYSPDGNVHLELHYSLREAGPADGVLARAWEYAAPVSGSAYTLDPAFHLLYLLAHAVAHLFGGGGGIRPMVDLYLLRHASPCDEGRLAALLSECGLSRFADVAFRLGEAMLGDGEWDDSTLRLAAHLLGGQLYADAARRAALLRGREKTPEARRRARAARRAYVRERLFLSREQLCALYPVLRRHAWLTPLCQVRRWLRLLFGGRLRLTLHRARAASRVTEGEGAEATALLTVLGLEGGE